METRWLEDFVSLAETRSFRVAFSAARRYINFSGGFRCVARALSQVA
jgi:hypothetical protein